MLTEKILLEQQLQSQHYPSPQSMNIAAPIAQQQTIQLLQPLESTQNEFILPLLSPQDKLQELSQKLEIRLSSINDFIFQLSKDEYQYHYMMNWLASFFQNLNKSARAIVLIGDRKTTNILSQKIIQPIFAFRQEYFSVINNDALKKDDSIILKNKIFYHIDADDIESDKTQRVSELIRTIIKPDTMDFITAMDKDETYIYGETIVTSSNKSAYPFLKNSYSRCSVFSVKHIDTILQKFNVDPLELDELIENDLENFSNILAQYQTDRQYFTIAQTDEKNALQKMKKGILLTPMLESYIQQFIVAIKDKVKEYFKPLELEEDKNLYKELVENFDNDDAIYQPLLSEYFNIIHEDIIFLDNSDFIDILKERECLFNQTPDDKFKANGQKRYKLYEYKLAKNYKGSCKDTI